jgi:Zn-dependent M28 family amino/carboxypeptidase
VLFDAEDNPGVRPWGSIMGSRAYVANLDRDAENIRYAIIADMVGDQNQIIPIEANSNQAAPDLVQAIWGTADDLGYGVQFGEEADQFIVRYSLQDDHISFIEAGIPAVVLIDFDYPYWHTTQDTLDKISPDSLQRVGDVLLTFLERDGVITRR